MLHSLSSVASQREIWWCYGTRNGREHPFAAETRRLLSTLARSRSFIAYSKPENNDQIGRDYDSLGRLNIAELRRLGLPQAGDFYLCGPPAFLADITVALTSWGVLNSSVHSEVFGTEAALTPGIASTEQKSPHQPAGESGNGPNVSFTRSGLSVKWSPRFQNLLGLAEACDVPVRWSCRVGVCHTCESGLIDGRVSYAPEPLDRPAEGSTLICCSAPTTDVELDL